METLASNALPANADNTGQVESTEADANVEKTNADGSAPSVPEADTPAKVKKDPVQERFDKLTRDKYDNARLADQRGYELERERTERQRLEAQIAELQKAQTSQTATDKFPTLEEHGFDEGKFMAAVAAYTKGMTESAKAAAREAAKEELQAEREAGHQKEAAKNWATKEAEFIKSKPDYLEKISRHPRDGGPAINESMFQICQQSPLGPQILYHLSENTEQSRAIYSLPPILQAKEIGRIEARLESTKTPAKPAVSQAPPPVKKVDGDDAQAEKSPSDMSDAEFAKWRKRQIAQRRNN